MGKELFNIINDMTDVLDIQQLKKFEEVLVCSKVKKRSGISSLFIDMHNMR